MTTAHQIFTTAFENITKTLEFNSGWNNGTGYYNGAVKAVKLSPGERAKSVSDNDRKIIFVGTRLGTAVFFERYSGGENGIVVNNCLQGLNPLVAGAGGYFTADEMMSNIGIGKIGYNNIGMRLETIAEAMESMEAGEEQCVN